LWKCLFLKELKRKSDESSSHPSQITNGKSTNHFQIKAYKLHTNEIPQNHKKSNEEKSKDEKKLRQSASTTNFRKKNSSISPTNNLEEKKTNHNGSIQKNYRSLSIYTESNVAEHGDNLMKNEDLMLKILQPLNCDNINKAKQFTELKGFFNSLIMISPTKNLTKIGEVLSNHKTNFKKNRKKM